MEHRSYRTIAASGESLLMVQKSRFIGAACPCSTVEEATAFLLARKKKNPDARHHVFAYALQEGGVLRCSDDGEPQGTAGHPMLEYLGGLQLWDVCVVVTRYFGGKLLGTGGLMRAYTNVAKNLIDAAPIQTMRWCIRVSLIFDYPLYGTMMHWIDGGEISVVRSDFGTKVLLELLVLQEQFSRLTEQLREISNGELIPTVMGEGYEPMDT